VDYKYPFNDITKFEVGYQGDFETDNEDFTQSFLDTSTGNFFVDEFFSNSMEYRRDIHSGYGLFASSVFEFEYQLGLRAEYTDRSLLVPDENQNYLFEKLDFFPSLNFSRKFEGQHQIMGGYSRRINRPRGYWLEPFPNYRDAFSYRVGDPEIEPEYTDSYELGYMKYFDKAMLSIEGYYRYTTNQFNRFASIDENGLFRYSPRNVGDASSSGIELSFNDKPKKWFSYNIIGNVFYQTLSGDEIEEGIDTENVTWNMRAFTDFQIMPNLKLQLSGFYRGPEITAQGERDPFYFVDAGLRMDLMERKLNLIFNVRNVFDTMAYQGSSRGTGFYNYFDFEREAYIAQFTINYRFNDYKQQRGNRGEGGGMDMDMDF
jgi:outer membrane receptor protein involved in Fe transport